MFRLLADDFHFHWQRKSIYSSGSYEEICAINSLDIHSGQLMAVPKQQVSICGTNSGRDCRGLYGLPVCGVQFKKAL